MKRFRVKTVLACQLLNEDRLDANLVGIQSLRLLRDSKKCGPEAALLASKEIISHSEQEDLRNIVASLIETGVIDLEENDPLNKANGIFFNLRANSFLALCNALKVCAKDGSLFQSIPAAMIHGYPCSYSDQGIIKFRNFVTHCFAFCVVSQHFSWKFS